MRVSSKLGFATLSQRMQPLHDSTPMHVTSAGSFRRARKSVLRMTLILGFLCAAVLPATPPQNPPDDRKEPEQVAVPEGAKADPDQQSQPEQPPDPDQKRVEPTHVGLIKCTYGRDRISLSGLTYACWDRGVRFTTRNEKRFLMHVGGHIQYDFAGWAVSDDLQSAFSTSTHNGIRRAMIGFTGTIGSRVEFKFEPEFASFNGETRDMWIGIRNIKYIGSVRFGRQSEPISLQEHTSSNYLSFMERSVTHAFVASENAGITVNNVFLAERMTMKAGVFWNSSAQSKFLNVSGRVTWLPVIQPDLELVHVGFGWSHRRFTNSPVQFGSRPESYLSPILVDTGKFDATSQSVIVPEFAWVRGSWTVQAEGALVPTSASDSGDPFFGGYHVEGAYFLTGEIRRYLRDRGYFGYVKPKKPVGQGGRGALELAFRYSHIDLDSGLILGGSMRNISASLNWYPSIHMKLAFNYIHSNVASRGNANIFQTRLQVMLPTR